MRSLIVTDASVSSNLTLIFELIVLPQSLPIASILTYIGSLLSGHIDFVRIIFIHCSGVEIIILEYSPPILRI